MSGMELKTVKNARIDTEDRILSGKTKAGERFRRWREGNWVPDRRQGSLFCICGALPPLTAGLCPSCYRKWRHSLRFFGGIREAVLDRDGRRCRACGSDHWIGVHHRKSGENRTSLLITVCAACHARIHRLLSLWKWIPALLAELWTEQHPGVPVQLQFEVPVQRELGFEERQAVQGQGREAGDQRGSVGGVERG